VAPVVWCLLAAVLFGASTPLAKTLLEQMDPWALAGLLYLGAALATVPFAFRGGSAEARWSRRNLLALGGAVVFGGIAGPVLLLFGLAEVDASSAALWLNLETVATSLLALLLFRESIDRKAWVALVCITGAGVVLALPVEAGTLRGALLIGAACICWGLDNNLTSIIDGWTPAQSTAVKGTVAGTTNLAIASLLGGGVSGLEPATLVTALTVGAVCYGVSLVLYIRGAQQLGASRSQILFSTAPFAGVAVAVILLGDELNSLFIVAGALMAAGIALLHREHHGHRHRHTATVHTHRHRHDDGHHSHDHEADVAGWHIHEHEHDDVVHEHAHRPDLHHRHVHLLLAGLLSIATLVVPGPAEAVVPPGVRSRLIVTGTPHPGGEIDVRVEVSWPGRPETFNPGIPKLRVPEEGAVRLGGTGSTFQRGRTRWWTDTTVTLPDWDSPWMIGPAVLDLVDARGAPESLSVASKRLRQKRGGGLLGRGLGSTFVLLFAAFFVLRLYRRLGHTPAAQDRDRRAALVDTCTRAYDMNATVEFLRAALQLRKLLETQGAAPQDGPDAGTLTEQLDRVRFGGEEMGRDACREVLEPLVAAARQDP
jgi:drug/metabolite transporter (DMT)-like permease